MRTIAIILALVMLAACTSAPSTETTTQSEPIKIGWIGPLSGDAANIGLAARDGAELAAEEINAQGGINGRPLEVIYEDGQCNGAESSKAANKLLNIDNVPVIVGGACSGETQAFAAQAEQMGRVVVSYCSSAPAITDAGDYIFRTYPSDTYEGEFSANYLYDQGARKVAVLTCLSDWCQGIAQVFEEEFSSLEGAEITESENYEQSARDLRAQLTKLKATNPDVLYFIGYTEASIIGIKQARELDWDVEIFGANAWDDAKIAQETGDAGEGIKYALVSPTVPEEFKNAVNAKRGNPDMVLCLPQSYDTVKLVAQVMQNGATTPDEIKDALYSMSPYSGVTGTIEFDENGDPKGAKLSVKQYQNGELVVVE